MLTYSVLMKVLDAAFAWRFQTTCWVTRLTSYVMATHNSQINHKKPSGRQRDTLVLCFPYDADQAPDETYIRAIQ